MRVRVFPAGARPYAELPESLFHHQWNCNRSRPMRCFIPLWFFPMALRARSCTSVIYSERRRADLSCFSGSWAGLCWRWMEPFSSVVVGNYTVEDLYAVLRITHFIELNAEDRPFVFVALGVRIRRVLQEATVLVLTHRYQITDHFACFSKMLSISFFIMSDHLSNLRHRCIAIDWQNPVPYFLRASSLHA